MTKLAITVLAAVALVQPVLSKPSSYVAHPHTNHHVYGSPIGRPIAGRGKTSHRKHAADPHRNRTT
jgi:hypothetical protein